ncbi:hypothetical protein LguiB_026209 [Lonicera macranthoides]
MEYVAMCSDQLSLEPCLLLSSCHLGQPSEFIYRPKGVDLITIMAGLAATYGLNLNVLQAWVIWNLCNVENKLISVERIFQYTKIESEAPPVIDNCRPELDWPINGRIELENLVVQYNPALPTVLKGITCTFPTQNSLHRS